MPADRKRKVIYYHDPVNDDFAGTKIKPVKIGEKYRYYNGAPVWKLMSFILYRLIATPFVYLYARLLYGLRVKNKKAFLKVLFKGVYMYGNHTQFAMDAFVPTILSFPKKAYVVVSPDTVSLPGLKTIVGMLGAVPVPNEVKGFKPFGKALTKMVRKGSVVTVYPEAHIWPWYTGIRPFPAGSFTYPVRDNVPVIAFVTTYRKRKILQKLPPHITVTLSDPMYPDTSLPVREAKEKLRNSVYDFMCRVASDPENYAYYEYRQVR